MNFRHTLFILIFTFSAALIVSCDDNNSSSAASADEQLASLILDNNLDGDALNGAVPPAIGSPMADLGKRLFFSKSLGGEMDASCASCHHPVLGGGDALVLPVGVHAIDADMLGPGRVHDPLAQNFDGGPTVPRNSPTTFNLFLWQRTLFWDGRVEKVDGGIFTPDSAGFPNPDPLAGSTLSESQARFPVTSGEEMRAFVFEAGNTNEDVRSHLAARIGNNGMGAGEIVDNWLPLFQVAFEDLTGTAVDLITYSNIVEAIGSYEDSQVFINTPWKDYIEGNEEAISDSAKRGALLFYNSPAQGGMSCVNCHSGDFFTDEDFHLAAFPQVGRGKGNSVDGSNNSADFGRERVTGILADRYAFRTPSLLNVAATGPWTHAGAMEDLSSLVRYHANPEGEFFAFSFGDLPVGTQIADSFENTSDVMVELGAQRTANSTLLAPNRSLSDGEVADIVAFLNALTDPRVLDPVALEPWIGRNDETFTDSNLLDAHDGSLNQL
ncbi:MAG: cytochrome-c peroxidase [Planctomycetota bacterium]|nr:cytochrome-c peroxidase [Planctomycetota bacterium]